MGYMVITHVLKDGSGLIELEGPHAWHHKFGANNPVPRVLIEELPAEVIAELIEVQAVKVTA